MSIVIEIKDTEQNTSATCDVNKFVALYEKVKEIEDLKSALQHIEDYVCLPGISRGVDLGIYLLKSVYKTNDFGNGLYEEFIDWEQVWNYGDRFANKYNGTFTKAGFLIKAIDFSKGIKDEVKKMLAKKGESK